jgi:hypothetical protein
MRFALEVGNETEKFLVEYEFNQLLGSLVIKVNNEEVKKCKRWFSEPVKECHLIMLGDREPMEVRIEKERKLLFGQRNRVFVNERLVRCFEGV